jgi:ribosome-binding ATPase YchF (GTP1/OBG family)
MDMTDDERAMLRDLHLLTMKPMLYVANIDENAIGKDLAEIDGQKPVPICAKIEAEMAELPPEELSEYLELEGLEEPGLNALIRQAYDLLGLHSFFTGGPKEARAWTVRKGATAPEAAGEIHTDFERGFIKAEVASFEDFDECGGESGAAAAGKLRQAAGKLRQEGKDYVVADGDVIHFKFNV